MLILAKPRDRFDNYDFPSIEHAWHLLDEVASWEEELKDYYSLWLKGRDLQMAHEATSSERMLR